MADEMPNESMVAQTPAKSGKDNVDLKYINAPRIMIFFLHRFVKATRIMSFFGRGSCSGIFFIVIVHFSLLICFTHPLFLIYFS